MANRMADRRARSAWVLEAGAHQSPSGIAAGRRLQTTDDEGEYGAERQHERRVNQKALARAEAVGNPTHNGWYQDRAQSLPGLAKSNHRALLVTADGERLHR